MPLYFDDLHFRRKGEIPEAFAAKYQVLKEIRDKLEKLSLTQAWSLRETDLYDYQRQLEKIDQARVDGNFVDSEGKFAELYVQRVGSSFPSRIQIIAYLTVLDTTLSHPTKLRIHLLLDGFFRAGIGSTSSCVQPASDTEKVSH
jgi:hypothetical protein